jgi:hypothetical protein
MDRPVRPTSMRNLLVAVVLLALIACGRSSSPAVTPGIFGTVTAGPTCPVERMDSACPPGVWTGEVRATDGGGNELTTGTDERGNYSLALEPGTYEVAAVTGEGPPIAKLASVVVVAGPPQRAST